MGPHAEGLVVAEEAPAVRIGEERTLEDVASLGPIAENMEVETSDGKLLCTVKLVWGGLTNLDSAIEAERQAGTGAGVENDPGVSDLPEGTTELGSNVPSYMEVESATEGVFKQLYVPLEDVADISSDRVILKRTAEEALGGAYDRDPSET